MPIVEYRGRRIEVEEGSPLRSALLKSGLSPHNHAAKLINCLGLGTCGTCAVHIQGRVSAPSRRERWRLSFPPYQEGSALRLACQVRVQGDLVVTKNDGFWGAEGSWMSPRRARVLAGSLIGGLAGLLAVWWRLRRR